MKQTSATMENNASVVRAWQNNVLVLIAICCFLIYSTGFFLDQDSYSFTSSENRAPMPAAEYFQSLAYDSPLHDTQESTEVPIQENVAIKQIFLFTPFFNAKDWNIGLGREPFLKHNCPINACNISNDKKEVKSFSNFDAILFHIRDMKDGRIPLPNQKTRKPHQYYGMFILESPLHDNFPYKSFKNFFNWTMTYRDDSDVRMPYGYIEPKDKPYKTVPKWSENHWLQFDSDTFKSNLMKKPKSFLDLAKKPKMVAWIVSNCGTSSERESYVKELKRHIPVDTFGACAKNESFHCEKRTSSSLKDACSQAVENDYKFYLSFENSICDQYVTEKFFLRMTHMAVPIVMGGGPYNQMAPPRSYISVADYESPQDLAKYLWHLNESDEEYLSYFWWKEHYQVRLHPRGKAFCNICAKLHEPLVTHKSYTNLNQWWKKDSNCKPKGSFPWSEKSWLKRFGLIA